MNLIKGKWTLYFSASAIAVLFMVSLYLLDTPIGMSNGYIMISEYCEGCVDDVAINDCFPFDWQSGFIIGIFLGGLTVAWATGKWELQFFPEDRKNKKFFPSVWITVVQGITGGFLVMLGLQLAGDSFIGQWAAAMQLSTGAWLFLGISLFTATGIILVATGKFPAK